MQNLVKGLLKDRIFPLKQSIPNSVILRVTMYYVLSPQNILDQNSVLTVSERPQKGALSESRKERDRRKGFLMLSPALIYRALGCSKDYPLVI
jgi:hypothetical protein